MAGGIDTFPSSSLPIVSARNRGSFSTTSTTNVTALSLTGQGVVYLTFSNNSASSSASTNGTITVDNLTAESLPGSIETPSTYGPLLSNSNSQPVPIRFSQSLTVQISTTSATYAAVVYWYYELY